MADYRLKPVVINMANRGRVNLNLIPLLYQYYDAMAITCFSSCQHSTDTDRKHLQMPFCFFIIKTNQMHQFHKFILSWNSTCFGQFVCPSSGVYSLYTKQWYMSFRFVDSLRAGPLVLLKPEWHIPLLSVQWINSWWWTDELSETCRVSWQSKFVKLVYLVGFIIKKFVTMQHGHMLQCSTVTWKLKKICRCVG
jgi:hypothetical protein